MFDISVFIRRGGPVQECMVKTEQFFIWGSYPQLKKSCCCSGLLQNIHLVTIHHVETLINTIQFSAAAKNDARSISEVRENTASDHCYLYGLPATPYKSC